MAIHGARQRPAWPNGSVRWPGRMNGSLFRVLGLCISQIQFYLKQSIHPGVYVSYVYNFVMDWLCTHPPSLRNRTAGTSEDLGVPPPS